MNNCDIFKSVHAVEKRFLNLDLFMSNYLSKRPVKILGLADTWLAMDKWTEDFFRESYGDLIVPVRKYKNSNSIYEKIHMKLSVYLDYWNTINDYKASELGMLYLADWEITRQQSPLVNDFTTPIYFQDDWFDTFPKDLKFGRTWIFMGHPYVSTPLHQDTFASSAWLTMIQGKKNIRLISPEYADFINKKGSLFDEKYVSELFDKNIPIHEVTIERGETLFIPGRWFHEVRNVDKNIMLTKNFLDKWNFLHFTVEFEEKFNQPIRKILEERRKFIANHLTNEHMLSEIQPYIPAGLNNDDKRLLSNSKR